MPKKTEFAERAAESLRLAEASKITVKLSKRSIERSRKLIEVSRHDRMQLESEE